MLRVKTPKAEFEAAQSNGYVYGQIVRQGMFPVYVELGIEREYIPSPNDNPTTEYKFFTNCTAKIAQTEELLDAGKYVSVIPRINVVIYC